MTQEQLSEEERLQEFKALTMAIATSGEAGSLFFKHLTIIWEADYPTVTRNARIKSSGQDFDIDPAKVDRIIELLPEGLD